MKSRKGIYYNLQESTYRYTLNGLTYVFSSDLYMLKFIENYEQNRNDESLKFTARYRLRIHLTVWADILYYSQIEKRGFLILNSGGDVINCKERVRLDGNKVTLYR